MDLEVEEPSTWDKLVLNYNMKVQYFMDKVQPYQKARWIKLRDYYYSTTYYIKLHRPPSHWKNLTPAQLDFMEYGYDRHGYRQAEKNCKPLDDGNQDGNQE